LVEIFSSSNIAIYTIIFAAVFLSSIAHILLANAYLGFPANSGNPIIIWNNLANYYKQNEKLPFG